MGYSRRRPGKDGKPRWTAYYIDLKGRELSAGTYATKTEANEKWQEAESKLREGRLGDPKRGRMKFERYVLDTWLPNHVMEAKTRETYTSAIHKHILPWFGSMRMIDILPEHVREWIADRQANDVSPATIKHYKATLSAIFTTAFNDQVVFIHPCKGVKTPATPTKPRTVITPQQFDKVLKALKDPCWQLLVETDIESGLRWGELIELRVNDLDTRSRILTVSRVVVELSPKYHPEGKRFLIKEYPKDKEYRRFKVSAQIVSKLKRHIKTNDLGPEDLLFSLPDQPNKKPELREVPNPDELGLTEPNEQGRQYKHGTMSGYGAGRCRCDHCRAAVAIYRAQRRSQGKDSPRKPRIVNSDGYIPNYWFRNYIWKPALKRAKLPEGTRVHDLRHAHASWLLAGGADLQVVKERLGHGSIATTEKYLHTLPDADETALDALSAIRNRTK